MVQELGFFEAVNQRRSVRIFDQKEDFDHEVVKKCLEAAILSPNSSNLQLYHFIRVPESSALKDPLAKLCMGQKAATTTYDAWPVKAAGLVCHGAVLCHSFSGTPRYCCLFWKL